MRRIWKKVLALAEEIIHEERLKIRSKAELKQAYEMPIEELEKLIGIRS